MSVKNTNRVRWWKGKSFLQLMLSISWGLFPGNWYSLIAWKKIFLKFPTSVIRDSIAHRSCVQWPDVFLKSHYIYFIILADWYLLFPFHSYYKLGEQVKSILGKCSLHHTFYPGKHFLTNCAAIPKGGGAPQ